MPFYVLRNRDDPRNGVSHAVHRNRLTFMYDILFVFLSAGRYNHEQQQSGFSKIGCDDSHQL